MTKDLILEVTYHLVARHGYDKITTSMIADEVGIKKPSLYNHFKNKEELFIAMIDKYYMVDNNIDDKVIYQTTTPKEYREIFSTYGRKYIELYKEDADHLAVVREIDMQSLRNNKIKEKIIKRVEGFYLEVIKLFEHGKRLNAFREGFNVNENAEFMMLVMQGIDTNIINQTRINVNNVWNAFVGSIFS